MAVGRGRGARKLAPNKEISPYTATFPSPHGIAVLISFLRCTHPPSRRSHPQVLFTAKHHILVMVDVT